MLGCKSEGYGRCWGEGWVRGIEGIRRCECMEEACCNICFDLVFRVRLGC